jgi:hypothetical protein
LKEKLPVGDNNKKRLLPPGNPSSPDLKKIISITTSLRVVLTATSQEELR